MTIKRFGQQLVIRTATTTTESMAGDLLTFRSETANPPAASSVTIGTVADGKMEIEVVIDGKTKRKSIAWDGTLKSPAYQDRLLRETPIKAGESRVMNVFVPDFGKAAKITMTAGAEPVTVPLLDGSEALLLPVKTAVSVLPGMLTTTWMSDSGEALKSSVGLLGTQVVSYTVPKEEALKAIDGAELDIAMETLVPATFLSRPYEKKEATFRVKSEADDPLSWFPESAAQQVRSISPSEVELVITVPQLPDEAPAAAMGPEFLAANQFIQKDDENVVKHANLACGTEKNPAKQAKLMEQYVARELKKKNFSTALGSAAEVARNMEGDCTEHAVLLAAMLRAKGIPSRVVVGLVYVLGQSAFGGHMWTEAGLGDGWVPLDGTLGRGGASATHLKLADSAFDDEGPAPISLFGPMLNTASKMKIEILSSK